ncbi:hypothetical protein MES4922_610013 [Mesorhizobium ventifaucium]|uniref:Uncharacterized protein n=1 Tax=Mesorhizobium ventifaucium TaxID=666020 RepID=A0ABN8KAN5_9HYPH|nr:hypothetical protein MES4922_610013 [Mesorhizobium ventifaucium]
MNTPCISSGSNEAHRDILPGVIACHVGAEAGAGARQHAAELGQVRHDRGEAFYAAADHELLLKHADDTEPRAWLRQEAAEAVGTASSAAFAVGYECGMPKRQDAEPWPPLKQAVSSDEAVGRWQRSSSGG